MPPTLIPKQRIIPEQPVMDSRCWDVVCIGSGMGSLAAAATLARTGRSVLVLEAHTQLGGLTHTFSRKQVRRGTGLHYTGWPSAYFNAFPLLWEKLTNGQAPWTRLPDETDCYLHARGCFVKRAPRQQYRDDLHALFPAEGTAINRYLDDMRRITAEFLRFMILQALPPVVERLGLGWWLGRKFLAMDRLPVTSYMDQIGASQRLREHLWFNWGNFDGIPAHTSIGAFAVPTEFLMDGLWTIRGDSSQVAEAFGRTIHAAGGELRRGARVTNLIFQGNRVAGVKVGDEAIRARTVISGIGARETYRLLVPPQRRPAHAESIITMRPSCSILTLHLTLDRQAIERLNLNAVNYWVEAVPGSLNGYWDDLAAPPPWFVLSLAARFQKEAPAHLVNVVPAEIFVGIPGDRFAPWQGTQVMRRGSKYADFKARLVELTLERAEQTWPGFRKFVRSVEGSTPLTIQSYTGHLDGAAYGIASVPGRYNTRGLRVQSGIPGLMLTGQDVSTPGVIGAFYGGLATASAVLSRNAVSVLL
jgi:all-trans-retinol 13,14-reductase